MPVLGLNLRSPFLGSQELIVAYRANRLTTPVTLPTAAGTRRPHSRSPEVEVRHHCKRQLCYLRQPLRVQNTLL
jgi:hypothetical protein